MSNKIEKVVVLFCTFWVSISFAQEPFSSFRFGISAGSNFQTTKFLGSSFLLEIKTPLASNLDLK